jgi:prepilin-type N-terminal cleavage/methylation domain-containing protein
MRLRILVTRSSTGYSLIELLCVLAILGICLGVLSTSVTAGLRANEARGAAQVWQTAAAWAQVGVLWQGGSTRVQYESSGLALANDLGFSGGNIGQQGPNVPVTTNLTRWRTVDGVAVTYGALGAPDGGGSLYFQAGPGGYRVVVRPESGLTVRSVVEP